MNLVQQDGVNNASLPNVLAAICNDLILGDTVCQGWVYDYNTGIANFLGQEKNFYMDDKTWPRCNRPGASLWLLSAGMLLSRKS